MADHREEMHALLAKCRGNPAIPEELFRLLELVVMRFESPFAIEEVPTRPERKSSSGSLPAQHFQAARDILDGKEPDTKK